VRKAGLPALGFASRVFFASVRETDRMKIAQRFSAGGNEFKELEVRETDG
jgi:hypothetical protein